MTEVSGARAAPAGIGRQAKLLLRTMRPKQWTKNVFVWAALLFDVKILQPQPFLRTLIAFILFCVISSVVYIINDLVASGELSPRVALVAAVVMTLLVFPVALWLHRGLVLILYGYLVLMVAYSFWLKNIVIVDVLTIAAGFVLRVAAGVAVVDAVRFSPWIYVCAALLALFIAIGKRRQEIVLLEGSSQNTRAILDEYNVRFVDEMLAVVSSSTVMAYSLYTFSAPNLPPNHYMMLSVPFVLYGLFRYLYLIHVKGETEPPDVVVLKDRPLQIDILLFGVVVFLALYTY